MGSEKSYAHIFTMHGKINSTNKKPAEAGFFEY